MAQTGIIAWSKTAASNSSADSAVNFAEGQAPSSLNDSCRAVMASGAKYHSDIAGTITTGGTSTAYTATSNQVWAALTDGYSITLQMHATSGVAPTLAVDGLAAKPLQSVSGTALPTGRALINGIYTFVYRSSPDAFIAHGNFAPNEFAGGNTVAMPFYMDSAPTGWTIITTSMDDRALRVVSGSGAGGGTGGALAGTTAFTTIMASRTITQANLPSYNLDLTNVTATPSVSSYLRNSAATVQSGSGFTSAQSANGNVTFTIAVGGTLPSGGSGTAMDFAVKYASMIICTKT